MKEDGLGYNLVALIVLLILAVLILCCLCWLLILLCICCRNRRRNRKQEYVFGAYNSGHQSNTIKSNIYRGGSFRESIRRSFRNSFRRTEKPIDEMVILASVNNLNEPEVKEPIPVIDFAKHVETMHNNQDYLFTEEFFRIEPDHAPTRRATKNNKERNRFLSIAAYDHSRVVLEHHPSGSDYINANYINGYDEKSGSYIATQAPLASTANEFWCMVWEKEAPVIVMLTNLVENDKEKCHQYWPKSAIEGENVLKFSSFELTLLEESVNEHYTIRKLSIKMIGSNEKKTVDQYHFTSWPNHGTPSSSGPLLEFMDIVQQKYAPYDGPMVVHCR
uniref:Tyrosine-protein phosphatase domain-containing protein n=2 Tax=Amphimedon queenslandica TaxID=400682 RepID=A0A1X7UAN0_AMPQE